MRVAEIFSYFYLGETEGKNERTKFVVKNCSIYFARNETTYLRPPSNGIQTSKLINLSRERKTLSKTFLSFNLILVEQEVLFYLWQWNGQFDSRKSVSLDFKLFCRKKSWDRKSSQCESAFILYDNHLLFIYGPSI